MRGCLLALSMIIASMLAGTAVGQEIRSIEIIERALQAKPDTEAGRKVYREHCSACHGGQAHGNADEVIPALAGQLPIYVIKQLVDLAEGGRASADMHRIAAKKPLSTPQGLSDIAGYASRLPMAGDTLVHYEQRPAKPAQSTPP